MRKKELKDLKKKHSKYIGLTLLGIAIGGFAIYFPFAPYHEFFWNVLKVEGDIVELYASLIHIFAAIVGSGLSLFGANMSIDFGRKLKQLGASTTIDNQAVKSKDFADSSLRIGLEQSESIKQFQPVQQTTPIVSTRWYEEHNNYDNPSHDDEFESHKVRTIGKHPGYGK